MMFFASIKDVLFNNLTSLKCLQQNFCNMSEFINMSFLGHSQLNNHEIMIIYDTIEDF